MAMAMTMTTKPRVSKIVGIQFSILSPEEIRKGAVTEITSRDTYIGNKPVLGGLFCPYMGVSEPGMLCPTDGLDYMQTPGYFGYIELAMPVFYYQHLNTIHKILRCVCLKCSRLLINKDTHKQALKMSPDERWSYVFGVASKIKRCGDENEEGCGCLMPKKIKKENLATLIAEWDSDGVKGMSEEDAKKMNMQLTPDIVLKIFRRISDDDVSFMGFSPTFSRPDWMICQVLAVPPPAVRPSIKMDGQQRSEDDLTHIIVNIVKANKTLQEKIRDGAQASVWHMVLQYYCATLVDNNIPGAAPVAQRSGRKLKSIKERLNGKGGRVRGNLMGKRVDFSARSVITPDPNLSIRELGVPLKIAKNITKPVVVNDMNRRFLTKLVRNGPEEYPGAKILERKGGESISLRYADRENIVLYNGDIVHRHMMDGDGVLFNRQPTLHRMSMMCHIARIMRQGDTFRMNVGDTKPYNADFDGDEMNMHMPQDEEAEAELKNLAAVPYQIISPAKNQSIIGIFQDSLVGSYRFTRPNVSFTPREAMNLLMAYNGINEGLFATQAERITSFQILSQIMPAFTMKYKTKGFGENDDFATSPGVLEIVDGKYLRGQLDKDVLGGGSNGLITRTCNDFGNMAAAAFIDDLQNIVTEYMKSSAYSVGISDLIADRSTNEQITQSITAKKKEVKTLIDQTYLGIFENATGNTNEDEFEFQVTNILNKATNDSGKIGLKSLSKDNRFVTMVKSGSKGSDLNISQMIACLGQQLIDGKRIPYGFENRTLPHFTKYDDSPGARGFVENSFISGLTPEELFFHAMGGRVGLIDTAVKSVTWETPVVVVENDEPKYVKIGEWIDSHISSSSAVQRMTEQNMEYLELDHPVKIVTMDYDGHVSWETVSAVTRHDPGEKLYKITTHAGRYVTVTANKSLLVWNAELGEFREKYTDEIKVGDFVPVAKHVRDVRSGAGIDEIQMTKYFPKSEFIYGSEVKTAIEMMNESMQDRKKIPSNWWDENNNTAFTLPFDSKAKLQRAIVRSKIDELSANGVYPSSGSRQWGIVPETFELNFENGTFIGLFIAEGNINGANIYITNNDSNIREFVKTWFAKYNINCKEDIRKNNANGTTSTVVGTSCILAKFITQLVGHGADSKHVPNEAYVSNIEFVKGIISGYISGDGHVSRNSIESSSCSQRLTEDIAFLCSRIGVHARVFKSQIKRNNFGTKNIKPSYRLSIRSTNGQLFAEQIDLLHDQKNDRLKSIRWTSALNKVQEHNDVVLDAIVSIEFVDPALHPKMYDLTIPTTLNFGLANGLQVRDTSSTGYIQRRLIKGMEDLKIEYDMTVRNNKGRVIQFSYGEDGIDPVKVESQIMPLVNLGLDEIYAHYHMPSSDPKDVVFTAAFTKGVISRMKKQKAENDAKCKQWIDFMIEQREKIIQRVFRSKNNDRVYLPVAFAHTINNVKGLQQINNNSIVDITPLEAFAMIEAAYKRLETMHYCAPTQLFKVMFFYYLSPKDLLMVKRFNKKALTVLLEMIVLKYKNSLIAPGEMVGMISAQSIGEPTTQLTLNTFHTAGSGVAMKANVTRGVPRIEELLSITENPKNSSLTICLKKDEETDCERAKELIAQIELTQLSELVESVSICFDPDDLNTLIQEDRSTMLQYYEYQRMLQECAGIDVPEAEAEDESKDSAARSKWIIRMVMSREAMLDKRITMDDVHFAIKNSHGDDVSCIYADYNADKLVFRLRMNNINGKKPLKPKENPLDQSDKIYLLKAFQDQLLNNIVLRGLKNISKVTLRKLMDTLHKEDGAYVKKETWVLDTKGTNLMDVLALDYIDVSRTISDDIQEIRSVLGIEAAREALLTEMTGVFENDGTYINYHHLSLLCDRMTASAGMVSIFRHGINNDSIGPIAKASFEETPEMFLKAARHAELDQMRGISANVMCGQEGYYGTSSFQVMLDLPQMIAKMEDVAFQAQNEQAEIAEAMGAAAMDTSACAFENLTIESNVGSIQKVDLGHGADNYNVGF
jgi:DNA-directed RNA polymerase beta' subunit/intein/homing endonuclease